MGLFPSSLLFLSPEPAPEDKQFPRKKQGAEDCLVVASQPDGQIDIEIIRAVLSKLGSQTGQRAAPPVRQEGDALQKDYSGQCQRPIESPPQARQGERNYASRKEGPNNRMQQLDKE